MRDHTTNYVKICRYAKNVVKDDKRNMDYSQQRKLKPPPWDKLCIDLLGPYKISRKEKRN